MYMTQSHDGVTTVDADGLVPVWHQVISNHHDDVSLDGAFQKSSAQCNLYIDRLVQERRNSIANALELRLSCTNPSI